MLLGHKQVYIGKLGFVSERTIKDIIIIRTVKLSEVIERTIEDMLGLHAARELAE